MSDELEARLAATAGAVPEPPPDVTARARAAVLASADEASPTPLWRGLRAIRGPARVATALAGGAAVVAAVAVLLIATPSDRPGSTGTGLRPDASSLGPVTECAEPRLRVPCVAGTEPVRRATPALADAPWLYRLPGGGLAELDDSAPRPSAVFPAGTTYGQALDALVVSATLTGGLPVGASLGAPLPDGAVLLQPADAAEGIAVDLRAPFGYGSGRGHVFTPTLASAAVPEDGGTVWPRGTSIAVPSLPSCMVVTDRRSTPAACAAGEQPVVRGLDRSAPPLPEVAWTDGQGAEALTPVGRRRPVDDVRLPVLRADGRDGGHLAISDLLGRVVVLSFFASWCEPCSAQAAALQDLSVRFDGAGAADVAALGIVVNDRRGPAQAFLRAHELTLQTLFDSGETARRALDVSALPETVLIDRHGRIALRIPGPIADAQSLAEPLEALVAEAP